MCSVLLCKHSSSCVVSCFSPLNNALLYYKLLFCDNKSHEPAYKWARHCINHIFKNPHYHLNMDSYFYEYGNVRGRKCDLRLVQDNYFTLCKNEEKMCPSSNENPDQTSKENRLKS